MAVMGVMGWSLVDCMYTLYDNNSQHCRKSMTCSLWPWKPWL